MNSFIKNEKKKKQYLNVNNFSLNDSFQISEISIVILFPGSRTRLTFRAKY